LFAWDNRWPRFALTDNPRSFNLVRRSTPSAIGVFIFSRIYATRIVGEESKSLRWLGCGYRLCDIACRRLTIDRRQITQWRYSCFEISRDLFQFSNRLLIQCDVETMRLRRIFDAIRSVRRNTQQSESSPLHEDCRRINRSSERLYFGRILPNTRRDQRKHTSSLNDVFCYARKSFFDTMKSKTHGVPLLMVDSNKFSPQEYSKNG
jgi:hypothetical protein